jgi:two-component system LytT family sensor kinase
VTGSDLTPAYRRKPLMLVWALSFVFWTIVAVLWELSMSKWRQSLGIPPPKAELALLLINQWLFAALSPLIFLTALKYPLDKKSLWRRIPGYLAGGFLFVVVHVAIRVLIYPVHDPRTGVVFGLFQPAGLCFCVFKNVFLYDLVDDLYQVYLPVVVIAHAVTYHRRSKAGAVRASKLEKQLAEAQLHALKMQFHPHFLFNTMDSISALMHIDVAAADAMLTRFCDLLRQTLDASGVQQTTVREEMDFVDTYLSIEQVRLRERLSTHFTVDPETLDAMVPYLLLQPLVENAIRHAISKRACGGKLSIASEHTDGRLRLVVRDNGPDYPQILPPGWKTGLGLKITRERLQAFYGTDFLFQVHPSSGSGVEVIVEIPFRVKAEHREQMVEQFSVS